MGLDWYLPWTNELRWAVHHTQTQNSLKRLHYGWDPNAISWGNGQQSRQCTIGHCCNYGDYLHMHVHRLVVKGSVCYTWNRNTQESKVARIWGSDTSCHRHHNQKCKGELWSHAYAKVSLLLKSHILTYIYIYIYICVYPQT